MLYAVKLNPTANVYWVLHFTVNQRSGQLTYSVAHHVRTFTVDKMSANQLLLLSFLFQISSSVCVHCRGLSPTLRVILGKHDNAGNWTSSHCFTFNLDWTFNLQSWLCELIPIKQILDLSYTFTSVEIKTSSSVTSSWSLSLSEIMHIFGPLGLQWPVTGMVPLWLYIKI